MLVFVQENQNIANASPIKPFFAGLLLFVSIAVFGIGVYKMIKYAVFHAKRKNRSIPFEEYSIVFLLRLLIAATIVRYAAARAGAFAEELGQFGPIKELAKSFLYAMQSFTLDADYAGFLKDGSNAFNVLLGEGFARLFGAYVTFLSPVCAIAGGAVLFTIFIKLFPRIRLWLAYKFSERPIYYFSELNQESLALAESVYNESQQGKGKNPRLIFCDADAQDDNVSSENIERAKKYRGLLVKTSLSELELDDRGDKTFFLIGTDEENIAALSSFTAEGRIEKLSPETKIYVFTNENYGTMVEHNIRNRINAKIGKNDKKQGITIFSVNRHRSIVYNLLQDTPLYSAVNDNGLLRIALFGSGRIGTELFLAAYWCGQMLDRKLIITVVSDEKEELFEGRINHINTEILETREAETRSALLNLMPDDDRHKAPAYMHYEYIQSDVSVAGIDTLLTEEGRENGKLANFDYFVVALGTDKKNLETAEQIARIAAVKGEEHDKPVPVVCSIWDDELNKALNERNFEGASKTHIVPFGSLKDSFSREKILLEEIEQRANDANNAYNAYERNIAKKENDMDKFKKDPYTYWSNVARAIHAGYKAQALGITGKTDDEIKQWYMSMCDVIKIAAGTKEDQDGTFSQLINDLNTDKEHASDSVKSILEYLSECTDPQSTISKRPEIIHQLAWLEHRRWNAFMRSEGFRCPSILEEETYIGHLPDVKQDSDENKSKHKNLDLKLHPCIVECDGNGQKADIFNTDMSKDDCLDRVSRHFREDYNKKNLQTYDFKKYDYPEYE